MCRDSVRGDVALAEIRAQSGNRHVEFILADLASQISIRQCVATFKRRYDRLYSLLNCAGIRVWNRQVTEDGLELMFGTEYLGHFLLTNLLVDALKTGAPSRVVTISGEGHKAGIEGQHGGTIDFDNLQGQHGFDGRKAAKKVVLAKKSYSLTSYRDDRQVRASLSIQYPPDSRAPISRGIFPGPSGSLQPYVWPSRIHNHRRKAHGISYRWRHHQNLKGSTENISSRGKKLNHRRNRMTSLSQNAFGR